MPEIKSAKLYIGSVNDPDKYEPVGLVDMSVPTEGVKIKGTLGITSAGWVRLMELRAEGKL